MARIVSSRRRAARPTRKTAPSRASSDRALASDGLVPQPASRRLRIFAFDPSLSARLDTASFSEIEVDVPWEAGLEPGPVGEYVEVIDVDPASGVFYKPVDLDDPLILAQDGLAPSESNPQFHQQMVYAVAMTTIGHFERALGRVALWAPHRDGNDRGFVRRLRIYPHAIRERNAYYSPDKKALLFGYFPVAVRDADNTPGTIVHTCLSHDIVAHETTHALLDGVHPRFNEPVNHDVLAFHEAFADVVALFQHFSYPGVLREQIASTRGDLSTENYLGQLAQQFGRATGRGRALRDALGAVNPETGKWEAHRPDVQSIDGKSEPHDRGAILVAAIFGAFLKVYRARTADLYRIATEGTGVLREGSIHPDLANRLAEEASRCAQQTLLMCIRAIDYCPPVGIAFGDYLRAIVTADADLNPRDEFGYRLAFVESFRQWGISPRGVRSLSVESLLWPSLEVDGIDDLVSQQTWQPWNLESDRRKTWNGAQRNRFTFWNWLMDPKRRGFARAIGLEMDGERLPATVSRSKESRSRVAIEVHAVRTAVRRGARGAPSTDLVVEITQRRAGYFDEEKQKRRDRGRPLGDAAWKRVDFTYRAGCTLLIDPTTMAVRRLIRTPGTIADAREFADLREFLTGGGLEPGNAFEFAHSALRAREPFALLHRDEEV